MHRGRRELPLDRELVQERQPESLSLRRPVELTGCDVMVDQGRRGRERGGGRLLPQTYM